jgi:hypothetical protein
VFFIPLIPLKWGETFVECSRCKGRLREEVLEAPTNKQFGYMLALGARALYAKAIGAGFADNEAMIEGGVLALRPYAGDGYNEANLLADVEAFAGKDLAQYLTPLAGNTVLQGREHLIAGLVRFVNTQGAPPASVEALVTEAAATLQITSTHLAGIVAMEAKHATEEQ